MYEIVKIRCKGDMIIRPSAVQGLIKLTVNDETDKQQAIFAITPKEAMMISSALLRVGVEVMEQKGGG